MLCLKLSCKFLDTKICLVLFCCLWYLLPKVYKFIDFASYFKYLGIHFCDCFTISAVPKKALLASKYTIVY